MTIKTGVWLLPFVNGVPCFDEKEKVIFPTRNFLPQNQQHILRVAAPSVAGEPWEEKEVVWIRNRVKWKETFGTIPIFAE